MTNKLRCQKCNTVHAAISAAEVANLRAKGLQEIEQVSADKKAEALAWHNAYDYTKCTSCGAPNTDFVPANVALALLSTVPVIQAP